MQRRLLRQRINLLPTDRRLRVVRLTGLVFSTSERVVRPPAERLTERPRGTAASRRDRLYRRLLAAGDVLAATVALILIAGALGLRPLAILMPALLVVTCKVVGLYDRDDVVMRRSTLREIPRLAEISGLFALLTWLFADVFVTDELRRPDVLGLWVIVFVATAVARSGARALARYASPPERCAIVGDAMTVQRVGDKLSHSRRNIVVVATHQLARGVQIVPAPGPEAFTRWLREHDVERLVLSPLTDHDEDGLDFIRIAKAAGVRVSLLPRLLDAVGSSVDFEDVDGMTVLGVRSFGLARSSRLLKRGFDLLFAGLGVIAVSPLLAIIAVAIRLDSRGPVFFRQDRVGKDGVHFAMLKFRSMVPDAEALKEQLRARNETVGLFKIADDPRVTRVGKLLRATSLDELPQILNVLRGEMSLVGPRPLVIEEDALVSGLDRSRLHLTPGMTGPWQILGPGRVPLEEMVSIDYLYVANWTLWRDIEILVRTAAHVMRRDGV